MCSPNVSSLPVRPASHSRLPTANAVLRYGSRGSARIVCRLPMSVPSGKSRIARTVHATERPCKRGTGAFVDNTGILLLSRIQGAGMMGMPVRLVRAYTAVSSEARRGAGRLPTANRANRREFGTGPLSSKPNLGRNSRLRQRCVRCHTWLGRHYQLALGMLLA